MRCPVAASDAFFVAFTIPNLLRRLVGEGALTVAFVPVFSQALARSHDEARTRPARDLDARAAGDLADLRARHDVRGRRS